MEITYDNYPNHNKINDFDDSNNFSQDATKMLAPTLNNKHNNKKNKGNKEPLSLNQ